MTIPGAQSAIEQLALFDPLDASVAVYEPDGTFVYVNPATEKIFARPRNDLIGRIIWDLFPNAVGNPFHQAFERVRSGGGGESFDDFYQPWGFWFRNQIYARDGRIFVVAADITARKEAEARLAALARASDAFAHAGDVNRVFREIARVLSEQIGDVCTVRVLDEGTGDLHLAAVHDPDPATAAFLYEIAAAPITSPGGLAARVFSEGKPLLIPVVEDAHRSSFRKDVHRAVAQRVQVRSLMLVPLADGRRSIGVVVMGRHRTARPYTDEDLALVSDIAGRAGLALSRTRLAEAERAASNALAATNRTLEAVISAAPMSVMLLDLDGTVRLWNRAAERVFGWLADDIVGRFLPAVSDDKHDEFCANLARVAGGERFEGVEVQRATRDRGIIDVALWAAPVIHGDGRVQCLSVVVDITDRKRETARRELLAQASAVLASSLEMQEILSQLATLPLPDLADWCCVDILADDGWIDRVAIGHSDPTKADIAARLKRRFAPLPEVPFGLSHAIKVGTAQLVNDMTDEIVRAIARDQEHLDCIRAMAVKSYVCAPLVVGGRSLGALTFLSGRRTYSDADLAVAQELARRAASVLENARLYATTRALVHRLENIHGVTSELSRARTPEEVVSVAVRHGSRAVQAESCVVWLSREDGGLRLVDSWGLPASERERWRDLPPDPAIPGLRVVEAGAPLWVDTEEEYERLSPEIFARQKALGRVRPYGALPLTTEGRRTGVLVFAFRLGHRFSSDEKDFLVTLAGQCGQALQRAQLFSRQAQARSEADEARQVAEAASRAKDEFLAMLGHELRNPLAPIVTALQLMKLRGDSRSSKEQKVIERQVSHLLRLVDDLLDVSRITRGKVTLKKEPVELADAVAKAVEIASPLLEQKRHQLEVSVPRQSMRVDGDVVRLAQVVANLLTNAAKYTDPGGRIAVDAARAGDDLVLSVKDSGAGIDADLLPKIFDLFTQGTRSVDRAQGGLGIGLTLVRNLVEMHGGSVMARSDGPGKGSEFVVRLPALGSSAITVEQVPTYEGARRIAVRRRRVLVVDDNVDAAELIADYLRAAGHDVALAHDGAEALRVVEAFEPQVALLDIGLPVMDGYELAGRLKKRLPIRMAALTGYGQEHDRARSLRSGFEAHFVKPVQTVDLLRYLDE